MFPIVDVITIKPLKLWLPCRVIYFQFFGIWLESDYFSSFGLLFDESIFSTIKLLLNNFVSRKRNWSWQYQMTIFLGLSNFHIQDEIEGSSKLWTTNLVYNALYWEISSIFINRIKKVLWGANSNLFQQCLARILGENLGN